VTVDEFEQFRVNLDYTRRFGTLSNLPSISPTSSNSTPTTVASSSTPSPAPSSSALSPVEMFKRGIKRDPAVYQHWRMNCGTIIGTVLLPIKPERKMFMMY
jgi:hypothetical protein